MFFFFTSVSRFLALDKRDRPETPHGDQTQNPDWVPLAIPSPKPRGHNHERNGRGLNTLVSGVDTVVRPSRANSRFSVIVSVSRHSILLFGHSVLSLFSSFQKENKEAKKNGKRKFQVNIFQQICFCSNGFVCIVWEDWMYRDNHCFDWWELCINTRALW